MGGDSFFTDHEPRTTTRLKARYVFPVARPPIENGMVTTRGERIAAVGPDDDGQAVDLGDVAIVPGLVNAHTHLEFSDVRAPLGEPGMALPDWIRRVVSWRRETAGAVESRIGQGLVESLTGGATTLGEIATWDWRQSGGALPAARPAVVMFRELIGPTSDRIDTALATAKEFLTAGSPATRVWPALSPHAPYTVQSQLLAALVALSRQFSVPVAMHLAESPDEIELLQTSGGRFRELLEELNAWDARPEARYPRVLDYLERLSDAPRALVIHGNYLSDAEHRFLAEHSNTMSVVYCPRTHHFFRHATYPLARMLDAGVSVAVGTDSRASNPNLSLFEELRFIGDYHPGIAPARILELGTLSGARALGLDGELGTIEVGKRADLAVIYLGDKPAGDPHALLFSPAARVDQTWLAGRPVGSN